MGIGARWALLLLSSSLLACDGKPEQAGSDSTTEAPVQRIAITATAKGFEPAKVRFKRGHRAILVFTRTADVACVDAVVMPWAEQKIPLPLNEAVEIEIPDTSKAGKFTYACWMNMLFGRVFIDPP